MMKTVHEAATQGFGAAAASYARGRPDYPEALDGWLRDAARIRPGSTVVDLGAGTGKFVPRLMAAGATVIAVEPVAAMRAQLAAAFPAVDARAGTAESMPFDTGSIDGVVCAQAFHWFATPAALQEIARVLKPGGVLALIWNVRDESVPWVRRLTGLIERYEGDAPRYHRGDWHRVFPAPAFGPLEETRFPHTHVGTPERVVVDRFMSVSFIAALAPAERARVEASLWAFVAAEPELAGRETIAMPYETAAFRVIRDG